MADACIEKTKYSQMLLFANKVKAKEERERKGKENLQGKPWMRNKCK